MWGWADFPSGETMIDGASAGRREEEAWLRNSLERERSQARLFIGLATVLVPLWIPFDYLLEPAAAPRILLLRLADVVVGLACFGALVRSRALRAVRALAVIKVVSTGVAIALMLPMVEEHFWPYLLGFSLVFWGSAVVFALPTILLTSAWILTVGVAALATAAGPVERTFEELVGAGFFIVTMLVICVAQAALRARLERRAFLSAHRLAEISRRALESEALKSQFFANISHELRTPLALVLGPAERLLADPGRSGEQRDPVELINRNARQLHGRVNDLLDVARLELGQLAIHYARTDLAQIVRSVAADFQGVAGERGITLLVEAPAALPAEVDPDKMQAVLLNLLSNAFKVTPRGGRIRCSLTAPDADSAADGASASLEIADSGPGIAPEHRELVFQRFRQIQGGSTRTVGGSGLGLAITKELVELHRGSIEVGEAREGGASLRVELPVHAPAYARVTVGGEGESVADRELTQLAVAALEVKEPSADETAGEEPLVLVVEDHPELNGFVRASLSPGYRTASALDGRSGLDKALALRPDLIITDIMMPEMSGDQLVEAIRARPELEGVPILVLSARADDALRVRLLRGGAQDYVAKPFSADELRARVSNLVGTAQARMLLQADLKTKEQSIERLAREVTHKRRELTTALESTRMARDLAEGANELKSRFLRVVSHELRSPLTTLLLSIEHLKQEAFREHPHPVIPRMERAAKRLLDLVETLLEYARVESGRLALHVEPFDLVEMAREVADELRPQVEIKGLSLDVLAPEEPPPPLESDPRLVRLIVVNLVGNAIKFTARGGVTLSVDWEPGAHRLVVRDTGMGIHPEQRGRVFEAFEQIEPVRGKHAPGAGLGLALVREMVQALGGSIELDSALGRGSTFTVRLPLASSEEPVAEEHHGQHSHAR